MKRDISFLLLYIIKAFSYFILLKEGMMISFFQKLGVYIVDLK